MTKPTAKDPSAARLNRLRRDLTKVRLDALLVTNPLDVGYLTGFTGGDSYLIVPRVGKCLLISDFRYEEELAPFARSVQIVIRTGAMAAAVTDQLASQPWTVGVQGEYMSAAELEGYRDAVGGQRIVTTRGIVAGMRAVKDDAEIACIRRALDIQQKALLATLPTIKAGQTELEVAARLEYEMKRRGSEGASFPSIVAARAKGSLPHYRPGAIELAKGQPVLIDWGATWKSYHGDMTRTFSLGKWPAKVAEVYQIVLEAHMLSAAALAPGKSTREVDAVARQFITERGYGKHFGHGLGHGVGLNIHEEPRLASNTTPRELVAGNVVTIEPGIYLPGVGGVRIENMYVVTKKGAQNLCSLPRDMKWATL